MHLDRYNIEINKAVTEFTFISEGHLGKIKKAVRYEEMQEGIYNLGFGDIHLLTGVLDDTIITNNGDMEKVLATVAYSVYIFTKKTPNAWIYVTGSSQSRIRLYRMAINQHFIEISKDFIIYTSQNDKEWDLFEPTTQHQNFLIQRKIQL